MDRQLVLVMRKLSKHQAVCIVGTKDTMACQVANVRFNFGEDKSNELARTDSFHETKLRVVARCALFGPRGTKTAKVMACLFHRRTALLNHLHDLTLLGGRVLRREGIKQLVLHLLVSKDEAAQEVHRLHFRVRPLQGDSAHSPGSTQPSGASVSQALPQVRVPWHVQR